MVNHIRSRLLQILHISTTKYVNCPPCELMGDRGDEGEDTDDDLELELPLLEQSPLS